MYQRTISANVLLQTCLTIAVFSSSAASAERSHSSPLKGDGTTMRPRVAARPDIVYGPSAGGGGGSISTEHCPRVYGINIDVGSTVRRFGLKCTDIPGTTTWDLPVLGDDTGFSFPLECPFGYIVSGFYGRSGRFLDAVGLLCRPEDPTKDLLDTTSVFGGSGGGGYYWECPRSYHLGAVNIGSGASIDSIQPICAHD